MKRRLTLLVASIVGAVTLSSCSFDVYSLPLPGGADLGDKPITIEADFRDVLDLVPKSRVKVNDVNVGEISDVELVSEKSDPTNVGDYVARVTMEVRADTDLPADAVASIRQTSLLGEKFVDLSAPAGGGSGHLADGALIDVSRTGDNPEIEMVLSALSLLLNGGGVAQLKTISQELSKVLDGREDSARSVLTQIADLTGQLASHRQDIVDAIVSLNRLSLSVKAQQASIDQALDKLPSALESLNGQRRDLVRMLQALDNLSSVGVRVIQRSKQSTIESLRQLRPTLTQLANAGNSFVDAFSVSLTYPFVDQVVGRDPQVARNLQMGDYVNLDLKVDLNLTNGIPGLPGVDCTTLDQIPANTPLGDIDLSSLCAGALAAVNACVSNPSVANCQGLPAGVIASVCANTPLAALCPATAGKGNGKGNGNGIGGGLPPVSLPGVGSTLGGLLHGVGLPRVGSTLGASPNAGSTGERRVSVRKLEQVFDPALVSLLTPGMVLR